MAQLEIEPQPGDQPQSTPSPRTLTLTAMPLNRTGRREIIDDHHHYWNARWNARHTAASYNHLAILLVPFAHEGKQWTYRNARAVPWPKVSDGLAELDGAAQADGMLITDLNERNFLVKNGTGIILDFDLHRAWMRDWFAPVLSWLGCAGCSHNQEGQAAGSGAERRSRAEVIKPPLWPCGSINFCSQVRLSPFLNLYGSTASAQRIDAALWHIGHGSRGGKVSPQAMLATHPLRFHSTRNKSLEHRARRDRRNSGVLHTAFTINGTPPHPHIGHQAQISRSQQSGFASSRVSL